MTDQLVKDNERIDDLTQQERKRTAFERQD